MNLRTVLFLILHSFWSIQSIAIQESTFINISHPACFDHGYYDVNTECLLYRALVRSSVECTMLCSQYDSCTSAIISNESECFLHQECTPISECNYTQSNYTHFIKSNTSSLCLHDGEWLFDKKRCACKNGWIGKRCDSLPSNCNDLKADGYGRGHHRATLDINQDGSNLLQLYCHISLNVTEIIILNNNGQYDFNRTWEEYEKGFGESYQNTWIGLRNVHLLTQTGLYQRFIFKIFFKDYAHKKFQRSIVGFVVSSSVTKYTFNFEQSYRDAGPKRALEGCFTLLKDKPFSTWDRDNDEDSQQNCAALHGAGWWYSDCNSTCNLAGFSLAKSSRELQGIDNETMTLYFKSLRVVLRTPL